MYSRPERAAQSTVLLVDDREFSRDLVCAELEDAGIRTVTAVDGESGWMQFQRQPIDLVITDLRMPRVDGLALLKRIRSSGSVNAACPVLLLSAYGSLSIAVAAGKSGATDFFPFNDEGVAGLVSRAKELLSGLVDRIPEALAGHSSATLTLLRQLNSLAEIRSPVLIRGAVGTGHEQVARYLHRLGHQGDSHFHVNDCRLRPGADRDPETGLVFLADVDQLSGTLQSRWRDRLSRSIQLGDAGYRVVASTERDLQQLVESGDFDSALFETLAQFEVSLPPLSEREEDIPAIIESMIERYGSKLGRRDVSIGEPALEKLRNHSWEQNLDEMERVVEAMLVYTPSGEITADCAESVLSKIETPLERISRRREKGEREQLLELWEKHGTYTGVADHLGITRNAAKYRFRRHKLVPVRREGERSE